MKTYPVLPNPPIDYNPAPLKTESSLARLNTTPQQGSIAEAYDAPVAGMFQLWHGEFKSQSYFGTTWDSKAEMLKQKNSITTNTHPHKGLVNRIMEMDDLALEDLNYELIHPYALPETFDLSNVQKKMDFIVSERETNHQKEKINRMFKIYWKTRLKNAFPRFFSHTLQGRELERFAAAVEMQKVGRVYVSKVRVQRIRDYNTEQARLTLMAMTAPILGRMISRLYRGYKARQRVKMLEQKRKNMRLLIKVQTRLRMILARNRRRKQKTKAVEWRAAKLVQRNWRGKVGKVRTDEELRDAVLHNMLTPPTRRFAPRPT